MDILPAVLVWAVGILLFSALRKCEPVRLPGSRREPAHEEAA